MTEFTRFDAISPIDYRYWDEEIAEYLSENAFTKYKLLVELALINALYSRGLCNAYVVEEMHKAIKLVTTQEVYEEEKRIKHDIRALVNKIREKVSEEAKPFIHMTATSYDIIDTAQAARLKDVLSELVIPKLLELEKVLIEITREYAYTTQVGRTHGQHAVPITFGFTIAGYVSRLGNAILSLKVLSLRITGKFSGAVGAYNASNIFFDDPEGFEKDILAELGLEPAEHSTQIAPPEAVMRIYSEITIIAGILANIADDMRHLQRSEINEIAEEFTAGQVGSSTMPQKNNPINYENVKSLWKIIVPRMTTVYMDQISEHQRDLTNSASMRSYWEMIAYLVSMTKRMTRTMKKLRVHSENIKKNLALQGDLILAEPLYIILASLGHPNAHEKVKAIAMKARAEGKEISHLLKGDKELDEYMSRMTDKQKSVLDSPKSYTGIAAQKAMTIADTWQTQLNL